MNTAELGDLELFVVYSTRGRWEPSWRPLQAHAIAGLFSQVTQEVYDHALVGWTSPFVKALGLPPQGALRKLPPASKVCAERSSCPLKGPECTPLHKRMPWCFVPSDLPKGEASTLGTEALRLWREGVYLVAVDRRDAPLEEDSNAGD